MKKQLCLDIEKSMGRELHTPKDFDLLRMCIYERLHTMISATTLKRIWGYLDEEVQTRKGSLDILAQFIGYKNFEDYSAKAKICNKTQSSPVMSRRLNVPEELKAGDDEQIVGSVGAESRDAEEVVVADVAQEEPKVENVAEADEPQQIEVEQPQAEMLQAEPQPVSEGESETAPETMTETENVTETEVEQPAKKRVRRRKKSDDDNKELFPFYEQSLF